MAYGFDIIDVATVWLMASLAEKGLGPKATTSDSDGLVARLVVERMLVPGAIGGDEDHRPHAAAGSLSTRTCILRVPDLAAKDVAGEQITNDALDHATPERTQHLD